MNGQFRRIAASMDLLTVEGRKIKAVANDFNGVGPPRTYDTFDRDVSKMHHNSRVFLQIT